MLFLAHAAAAQFIQQGSKLVGTGAVGPAASRADRWRSRRMAIPRSSADTRTTPGAGAAWVFTRSGGVWSQQGSKLVGTGAVGLPAGLVGGDLGGWEHRHRGRARRQLRRRRRVGVHAQRGVWSQQGSKLVGTGAVGAPGQGTVGGDLGGRQHRHRRRVARQLDTGAAWVFTRSGGVWSQQGSKLVGTGAVRACIPGHLGGDLGGREHRHRGRPERRLRRNA